MTDERPVARGTGRRTRLRASCLLAAAVVGWCLSASGLEAEDMDIRRGGSLWAHIESDGSIRIDGTLEGGYEGDGDVRRDGSLVGRIESDGGIRRDGTLIGSLEDDGTLRRGGTIIGRIEPGGTIRLGGVIWGEATPCCGPDGARRVTAVLAFFTDEFFGR